MKCISCGNLIPDASVVCPYCNSKVQPEAPATPVYDVKPSEPVMTPPPVASSEQNSMTSAIPETPSQPVLPQDQGMSFASAVSSNTGATNNSVSTGTVQSSDGMMSSGTPVQGRPAETTSTVSVGQVSTPLQPSENSLNNVGAINNSQPVNPAPVGNTVNQNSGVSSNNGMVPPQPPINANPNEAQVLANQGQVVSGEKIATMTPAEPKKKKKGKLILIIVIAVILLALIGGGVFVYFYEFRSGDTRIDKVVNGLLSFTNGVKNENVELGSGSYTIDATIGADDQQFGFALNGKYAFDLSKKLVDTTVNVESLNLGQELLEEELNLEVYLYDSKMYLLFQNFFEKYISYPIEGYDELFSGVEQNDINYALIINAYKTAIKSALKASNYSQTIKDVDINGSTQKANVITMNLTEANQKSMIRAFVNTLKNNNTALEEMAKVSGEDVATIESNLDAMIDNDDYLLNNSMVIEIYTEMLGDEFLGVHCTMDTEDDTTNIIDLFPITNGYSLSVREDDQEMINMDVTSTEKNTSTTRESTVSVTAVFYSDGTAANIEVSMGVVEDVNPNVEEVNVRNSVDYRYLSDVEKQQIINSVSQFGTLGLIVSPYLQQLLPITTPTDPNAVTTDPNASQTDTTVTDETITPTDTTVY